MSIFVSEQLQLYEPINSKSIIGGTHSLQANTSFLIVCIFFNLKLFIFTTILSFVQIPITPLFIEPLPIF